ncbi:hypothetical protein ACJ41O_000055 [Fusarium nematophilum]
MGPSTIQDTSPKGATFTNPILPGWHADPSCIFVPEWDNTFFCVTSSFMIFPGLPLYASKDLIHWRLVCNIVNRRGQVPQIGTDRSQDNGIFAPTIRYHDGNFYVIVEYVTIGDAGASFGLVFSSSDPLDSRAWSDPLVFRQPESILDPDLFWDDDGRLLVQAASFRQEIIQFELDLDTGVAGPERTLWKGTGGIAPEGPHLYKKDGWYYLLIAEGGTDLPHCVTIARSRSPRGPFEAFEENPILTNHGSGEYFQTVGHADLFHDAAGNWWGVALSTRSGPEYVHFPMGRETVLFPVTWDKDDWPRPEAVRGRMDASMLLETDLGVPGPGPFVSDGENLEFPVGSELPLNLVHWRFPPQDSITVSPDGHANTLGLKSAPQGLSGPPRLDNNTECSGLILVARRQTSTLFEFSIELQCPTALHENEEAGVTVFLTELQHISLSITWASGVEGSLGPRLKFRVTGSKGTQEELIPLPADLTDSLLLSIKAENSLQYVFTAVVTETNGQGRCLSRSASTATVSGGPGRWGGQYSLSFTASSVEHETN